MDKIIFFPIAFLVLFAGTDATTVLEDFCVGTLNQTTSTVASCMSYTQTLVPPAGTDPAVYNYVCCLGLLEPSVIATPSHAQYMNQSLIAAILQITTEDDMPPIADFIVMCKHLAVAPSLLQDVDYSYWLANGKTVDKCLAV